MTIMHSVLNGLTAGVSKKLLEVADKKYLWQPIVGGTDVSGLSVVVRSSQVDGKHNEILIYDFNHHNGPVAEISHNQLIIHPYEKNGVVRHRVTPENVCDAMRSLYQALQGIK